MDVNELKTRMSRWIHNLKAVQLSEGAGASKEAQAYRRGGIEAYERALEQLAKLDALVEADRRLEVLTIVARGDTCDALPAYARWETSGISWQRADGGWEYLNWWAITDFVINWRLEYRRNPGDMLKKGT